MEARAGMLISMVVFGTIGIFVKNIPLSSGEIALFRAVIAAAAICLFQLIRGKRITIPKEKKMLFLLAFSGLSVGFNWVLLFEAYRYTTVSIATLSYYFAPVIVMVLSPVLFRERITKFQIFCFAMATVGLFMIIGAQNGESGSNHLIGVLLGLGAAVFYACVMTCNKLIVDIPGIERTFFQFVSAIAVMTVYVAVTTGINIGQMHVPGAVNLLVVGLFHTGFTYCLYFSSIKNLRGQEIAILSYVDPLVAIIVSVALLHEPIGMVQIAGGLMLLGFTLLYELKSQG